VKWLPEMAVCENDVRGIFNAASAGLISTSANVAIQSKLVQGANPYAIGFPSEFQPSQNINILVQNKNNRSREWVDSGHA
jgi:hypothetical protein